MRRDADGRCVKDVVEGTVPTRTSSEPYRRRWPTIGHGAHRSPGPRDPLAGAYELLHRKDVPLRVAINEYVEIAHAFYDQGEAQLRQFGARSGRAWQARPAELVK